MSLLSFDIVTFAKRPHNFARLTKMTIKVELHQAWWTNLNKSRSELGPPMLALLAHLVLEAHLEMF